jgi:hypothetical protein
MSPEALKAKGADLRAMRIHRLTTLGLYDLARRLNPVVAGWMRYCVPSGHARSGKKEVGLMT